MTVYLGYYESGYYINHRTHITGVYTTPLKAERGILEYFRQRCVDDGYDNFAAWYNDFEIGKFWVKAVELDEIMEEDEE